MDHPFRSAAFGGFNRQDVLTYLESVTREGQQQREALQQELEETRTALAAREAELTEVRSQLGRLEQEKAELSKQLMQTELELADCRNDCKEMTAELKQLRQELEGSRAEIAALEPDARAYRELKERTAGVELEAHRRAQAIQEKAEGDARHLRRQMENWMQRMSREYDALRTEVETTVSHAAVQVDRVGKSLEQITSLLNEREVALESLVQSYADTDPARVTADAVLPAE